MVPLPLSTLVSSRSSFADRVVEAVSEGLILDEQAEAALAGVDLREHRVGLVQRGVEVVIERVVGEQLAGASLCRCERPVASESSRAVVSLRLL